MKKLFLSLLALVALASCSKDEVVQLNQDEIKFSVVTENATKVNNNGIYCNNALPANFKVWAKVGGNDYIGGSGDEVTKQQDASWKSSVTRYWPEGNVDFYAVAGMTTTTSNKFNWSSTSGNGVPATINYTVNTAVNLHEDVLYAYEQASKTDNVATLNFRHALSQVVFKAKNQHSNLFIEILGVSVCGVKGTGIFTYPSIETSTNNFYNHTGIPTDPDGTTSGAGKGSWDMSAAQADQSYSVEFTTAKQLLPKTNQDITIDLTADSDKDKEYNSNAMLLMPQQTEKFGESNGTAFFKIKCKIYNVVDNSANPLQKVQLFGGEAGDDAYLPFAMSWEMGKKYTYTFVFGSDTNGGVEEDPKNPGKPDPDNPVLANISYSVTVDEFIPVTGDNYSPEWNVPQEDED